jgi:4-hydroxy-tetrahydrodipicolinate reductase
MIHIAICGAGGRIGRTIYKSLLSNPEFDIAFGVDVTMPTDLPFPVFADFSKVDLPCDLILDYSSPKALDDILGYALKNSVRAIIATTGHSPAQLEKIAQAAKRIAIFKTGNMSLGINLLSNLCKDAAKFLGDDYDVEIVETHHNRKLDAPSGTAIMLADAVREVRDNLYPVYGRHESAKRRDAGEIGIHSLRGGTVVGKHSVGFYGLGEAVTLTHESESTEVFVRGSLKAARFLMTKRTGLYDMHSLIGNLYAVTTVKGVTGVTLVALDDIKKETFLELLHSIAQENIILDMISQAITCGGALSVSFTLSDADADKTFAVLNAAKIPYRSHTGTAKLIIEGAGMEHKSGVALDVLDTLSSLGATVYAITTSETKIACCINASALSDAIAEISKKYNI